MCPGRSADNRKGVYKEEASDLVIATHLLPFFILTHSSPPSYPPSHIMPARTDGRIESTTYTSSLAVPTSVIATLARDPRSNIIHAKLEKYRNAEFRDYALADGEIWIVTTTTRSTPRGTEATIDFVLSCTFGVTGNYPVFIFGVKHESDMSTDFIETRMRSMVRELRSAVSTRRVYSVFAAEMVAQSFVEHWFESTGVCAIKDAYYEAKFSYCTPLTLKTIPRLDNSVRIRPAQSTDVLEVAQLCKEFASESVSRPSLSQVEAILTVCFTIQKPFILDNAGALKEARTLIKAKELWVLEVAHSRGSSIACICALTRTAGNVSAVTKVYTPPLWRQRGYARQLVAEVCS